MICDKLVKICKVVCEQSNDVKKYFVAFQGLEIVLTVFFIGFCASTFLTRKCLTM